MQKKEKQLCERTEVAQEFPLHGSWLDSQPAKRARG